MSDIADPQICEECARLNDELAKARENLDKAMLTLTDNGTTEAIRQAVVLARSKMCLEVAECFFQRRAQHVYYWQKKSTEILAGRVI